MNRGDFFEVKKIQAEIDEEQAKRREKELYLMELLGQVNLPILEEISADD